MEELRVIDIIKKSFSILIDDPGIIALYALSLVVTLAMILHIAVVTDSDTALSFLNPMRSTLMDNGMATYFSILPILLIYQIIGLIIGVIVMAGVTLKVNAIVNNTSIGLGEAFLKGVGYLIPLVLSYIIFGLIVAFGLILLIIPGIYFLLKLSLFIPCCVLEEKSIGCIRRSWELTKGRVWKILAVGIILSVMSLVQFIPFVGSFIVSLIVGPISINSMTLIYLGAKKAEAGETILSPHQNVQ